jgi:hypothetical protein
MPLNVCRKECELSNINSSHNKFLPCHAGRTFLPSMGFFVICLIALMFGLTNYVELDTNVQDEITQYYTW